MPRRPRSNDYQPRHAKHADPAELPRALRGLADLITIIDRRPRGDDVKFGYGRVSTRDQHTEAAA